MDREKIIGTLEEIKTQTAGIGLDSAVIAHKFIDKILDLLKEQDTELSYRKAKAITHTATKLDDATCPSCGNVVGEK